jgi:hypothetical protein
MLKKPSSQQTELEMVALKQLVPGDHPLRKDEAAIDLGSIREMTEELYCPDNGRPPIPPEMLFKALVAKSRAACWDDLDAAVTADRPGQGAL